MTPTLTAVEAAIRLRAVAQELPATRSSESSLEQTVFAMVTASAHIDRLTALLAEARACLEPWAWRVHPSWPEDAAVRVSLHPRVDPITTAFALKHFRAAAALHAKLGKMG